MNTPSPADTRQAITALMAHLAIADPQAADRMGRHLVNIKPPVDVHRIGGLIEDVITALAEEISWGRALAEGLGRMLAGGQAENQDLYLAWVKQAADQGPTLAALFARHLPPMLLCGNARLVDEFEKTTRIMLQKGTYTLKAPLEVLGALIEEDDLASAHAFLELLSRTYRLDITYNRTVYLTHTLPRAVVNFDRRRRCWQIRGLVRVIESDERLADDSCLWIPTSPKPGARTCKWPCP